MCSVCYFRCYPFLKCPKNRRSEIVDNFGELSRGHRSMPVLHNGSRLPPLEPATVHGWHFYSYNRVKQSFYRKEYRWTWFLQTSDISINQYFVRTQEQPTQSTFPRTFPLLAMAAKTCGWNVSQDSMLFLSWMRNFYLCTVRQDGFFSCLEFTLADVQKLDKIQEISRISHYTRLGRRSQQIWVNMQQMNQW